MSPYLAYTSETEMPRTGGLLMELIQFLFG
jgi:hypothetical protein